MDGLTREKTRPNLFRETKFSGASTNGDRENNVPSSDLTTSRIANHTRLMPSLLNMITIN